MHSKATPMTITEEELKELIDQAISREDEYCGECSGMADAGMLARALRTAQGIAESSRLLLRALDEKSDAAIAFHTEGLRSALAGIDPRRKGL